MKSNLSKRRLPRLALGATFAALALAAGGPSSAQALSGPVTTPPGGVSYSQGTTDPGAAGGRTDTYSNFNSSRYQDLYWGLFNSGAATLSFDGSVDEPGETLTYSPASSDPAHGVLRFTGVTSGPPSALVQLTYNTLLTVTVTDANGAPLALASPAGLGLDAGLGGLLHVTGPFKVNIAFEAKAQGAPSYQPARTVYNGIAKVSGTNTYVSSFASGFYYTVRPPTAAFAFSPSTAAAGQAVSFDATGSTSPNGTITSYVWNFGDGTTDAGPTPRHAFSTGGTFTVRLTVTDSNGGTATVAHQITISLPALTAAFTAVPGNTLVGQPVAFDGSGSHSAGGTIVSYAWSFGDASAGSGAQTSHAYSRAGSYTVTLTVTDSAGQTATTSHVITASLPALTAAFTPSATTAQPGTEVAFDATASHSAGGTINSYSWDFGDGTTGSGSTARHTYSARGTYTVKLTVADSTGQTASTTHAITIAFPPLTASFVPSSSSTQINTPVGFDGSSSAALSPGDTITAYNWDFGDGTSGTGIVAQHTYTRGGPFTVTLTVTDDHGQTAHTSKTLTIKLPPPPAVRVAARSLRYDRSGFIGMPVSCSARAGERCVTRVRIVTVSRYGHPRRQVLLSSVFFTLLPGDSPTLHPAIRRSAYGLISKLRSLTVNVIVDTSNDSGNIGHHTYRLKLSPKR